MGLTESFYAFYYVILDSIFAIIYISVGLLILKAKSHDFMCLLASLTLITFGVTFTDNMSSLASTFTSLRFFIHSLDAIGLSSFILFFYLFPNGKFIPKWTQWLVIILIIIPIPSLILPNSSFTFELWPVQLMFSWILTWQGSLIFTQLYRYLYASKPIERQQTKWVVYGLVLALVGFLSFTVFPALISPTFHDDGGIIQQFVVSAGVKMFMMVIPITLFIALFKHRLWDIDHIIRRSLVYFALSASLFAIYTFIVIGVGSILQLEIPIISFIGALFIAILFAPMKARLQKSVTRLFYGDRDDPFSALLKLNRKLEQLGTPDEVIYSIVSHIKDALRIPYAALRIYLEGGQSLLVESGDSPKNTIEIFLSNKNKELGTLYLAPRSLEGTFSNRDKLLIDGLTIQILSIIENIRLSLDLSRLNKDLQESRERLVLAREEEKRKLRRELHDDLAPRLAALALTAATAEDIMVTHPEKASKIIGELRTSIRQTVGDIRRLVYELRPPELDQFGLIYAIRQRISEITQSSHEPHKNHLQVTIETPDDLPVLAAAIEVAAYRIIIEAITNVVRHSNANRCLIKMRVADVVHSRLIIEIIDNGIGALQNFKIGVGIRSMQERATELGGECRIEKTNSGFHVVAWLPIQ